MSIFNVFEKLSLSPFFPIEEEKPYCLTEMVQDIIGYIGAHYLNPSDNARLLMTNRTISCSTAHIEVRMKFVDELKQLFAYALTNCKTPEAETALAELQKEFYEALAQPNEPKLNGILCKLLLDITDEQFKEFNSQLRGSSGISLKHSKDVQRILELSKKIREVLKLVTDSSKHPTLKKIFPALLEHRLFDKFQEVAKKPAYYIKDQVKGFNKIFALIPVALIQDGDWDKAIQTTDFLGKWDDSLYWFICRVTDGYDISAFFVPLQNIFLRFHFEKAVVRQLVRLERFVDAAEFAKDNIRQGWEKIYAYISYENCKALCHKRQFNDAQNQVDKIPNHYPIKSKIQRYITLQKFLFVFSQFVGSLFCSLIRSFSNPALSVRG